MLSIPGYTRAVLNNLDAALLSPNQIMRPRIKIFSVAGRLKFDITKILSGEVTVDTPLTDESSTPTRKLSFSLYRPHTYFSPNCIWLNDLIKVYYEVWVPELDRDGGFIPIPVFAGTLFGGSVKKSEFNDNIVEVTAYSYDQRYMFPIGNVKTMHKNARYTTAMKNVISNFNNDFMDYTWPKPDGMNNTHLVSPSSMVLQSDIQYGSTSIKNESGERQAITPWDAVRKLGLGLGNWNIFFDSNFRLNAKPRNTTPTKVYSKDTQNMLTYPSENIDLKPFRNYVVVWGNPPIRGEADAKNNYKKSTLKWAITEEIQESTVQTTEAANALARQRVNELFGLALNIEFTALVEPRLQEGDYIQIENPDGAPFIVPLVSFNIPLTPDKPQTISTSRRGRLSRLLNMTTRQLKKVL